MQTDSFPLIIQPSSGVPIYRQIADQVRAQLASGRLAPGTMLPSIRQVASDLEVNMMTVSKAWSRLESEGLIERVRGSGMRVRPQAVSGRVDERKRQLEPFAEPLATRGLQLGLTDEQILSVVQSVLRERRP